MAISRGDLYWVDLGEARGSASAKHRPVLVLQADSFSASSAATGLPRDSVVNVTALITTDKDDLNGVAGRLPDYLMEEVDHGLRRVLGLQQLRRYFQPVNLIAATVDLRHGSESVGWTAQSDRLVSDPVTDPVNESTGSARVDFCQQVQRFDTKVEGLSAVLNAADMLHSMADVNPD